MEFYELIKYVKKDGCMVRLYDKKELKLAQCMGTFDISKKGNPIISLAINGHTKMELRQLLLHEYAHFLQWEDGTLKEIEGPKYKEGWDHLDEWLRGKYRSKDKIIYSRNASLFIEYDAEMRTLDLAQKLNVDIGSHKDYIRESNSYILLIKWSALYRKWSYRPDSEKISNSIMDIKELFLPLTDEELEILEEAM